MTERNHNLHPTMERLRSLYIACKSKCQLIASYSRGAKVGRQPGDHARNKIRSPSLDNSDLTSKEFLLSVVLY